MRKVLFATLLIGFSCQVLACDDAGANRQGNDGCKAGVKSLEQQRLQARTRLQALASVGSPGQFVCRKLRVGISEHDWIRGSEVSASDEKLRVRIADAGQFPHQFNGADLVAGTVIESNIENWVPCIPN